MIWYKYTFDLGKQNRDEAFLCHSTWFLTYNPIISRAGWRKEGRAKEKQQPCSDKAIPVFSGETCYGAPSECSKKNYDSQTCHEETQVQQNWCSLQDLSLLNLKMKDDTWQTNYSSLN